MANREKAELKILVYESEIEEYRRQIRGIEEQRQQWAGYHRAFTEVMDLFKVLFRDLKKALDWQEMTAEQRDEARKNSDNVPKIEVTNDEGFKIGEFLKPAHQLVGIRWQHAGAEPEKFGAQKVVLDKQINRLEKLIEYERTKPVEAVLSDPWNELNTEKSVAGDSVNTEQENNGVAELDPEIGDKNDDKKVLKFDKKKGK